MKKENEDLDIFLDLYVEDVSDEDEMLNFGCCWGTAASFGSFGSFGGCAGSAGTASTGACGC
ncbi:thiocillin family RiPP [Staphylococcus pseudintermedius]|nr:thiocillin family RiPP [Staphylococcus pseudintermedius]EGQ3394414.1 thiocillin family RiPP [Staphylococcus pseudintermedius]EGQ3746927.1 thiocillin family RiPP [Staphylococcus pseudintermedius]EGQ3903852.1 hypothetical protein [Staphylococcus pseudintermedius]EHD0782643.1 thiocillin family RiPP [Staphylococcus pseudintermedius]